MKKNKWLTTEYTKVTPAMAKNWMEHHNPHNRKLSQSNLKKLIAAVKAGEFVQNGDPIRFDWLGNLKDGQHRLMLVIATGQPIWMVIIKGLDPDCFTTIGRGKPRRLADDLSVIGEKNCKTLACAIQMTLQYKHFGVLGGHGSARKFSDNQALTAFEKFDQEHMRKCVTIALRAQKRYSNSGILAACGYLVGPPHFSEFERLVKDLTHGTSLVAKDPVPMLLSILDDAKGFTIKPRTLAALTVKAMNARLRHQKVIDLHWNESDPFPVLLDHDLRHES